MADDASYGSRENLRRRGGGSRETVRSTDGFHQPGQPIGYLAARGTPYEKKYFSRKLGICCLFIAPPIILVTLAITLLPVLYAVANHALHTSVLHIYASNITSPGNDSFPLTLEGQVRAWGKVFKGGGRGRVASSQLSFLGLASRHSGHRHHR